MHLPRRAPRGALAAGMQSQNSRIWDTLYETELQRRWPCVLRAKEFYNRSADEIGTELVFLKTGAIKVTAPGQGRK